MSSNPDLTVLHACLRFYLQTATAGEITRLVTPDLDWENLVQTAISQGVMPLLYQSLKALAPELVPRAVLVQLQHLNRMNGLHNFALTKELLQVLAQLDKAGIEAIAFKGPVLAASVYGNVALRQFGDLDILVRQRDFWQAKDVLIANGYRSNFTDAQEQAVFDRYLQTSLSHSNPESTMFGRQFQPSLLHSNSEHSIDLHWGIPPRQVWQIDRFELLWENLQQIDLLGRSIKTFSPEATLVVQCLNIAKEPWKRSLKQVCDAAQIIQAAPKLNWDSALALSAELRCQRLVLMGLQIAHHLLHIPLPQYILDRLAHIQSSKEWMCQGDRLPSPLWWWEYTDRLKTLDRWQDGLFITAHYLLMELKSLPRIILLPTDRDREFLPLPTGLFFLYYLIRPIRLLIKLLSGGKSSRSQELSIASSNPDLTVLLPCLRFYLHTATDREVTILLTPDLDWENLVQTAISQGVMPLLYQSLKALAPELVPRAVLVQLQHLNRMNGLRNFAMTKELLQVLAQLDKAGIEAIAFKGPVLAASVYGNVALRQFGDLDILVRYRDFWQAKAVLDREGYQSAASYTKDEIREDILPFNLYLQVTLSNSVPEAMMFNRQFQHSSLYSSPYRSIDLHWGIPPRRVWNPARFDRLWDRLDAIDLMGKPIKTCSPEATLVIQCLNVAKTPWENSLKQICDVVQIVRSHPDVDWHLALKLSAELRSQRSFLIGLRMTRDRLNVPLPQFILDKLIESQATDEKIAKSYHKCAGDVPYLWFQYTHQLRTSDRVWDRLFITGLYLQWSIVIALSPSPLDREFVALPNNLDFLYYLIRPIRLLIQYLPFSKSVAVQPKL